VASTLDVQGGRSLSTCDDFAGIEVEVEASSHTRADSEGGWAK
jgi:hypothetical protein